VIETSLRLASFDKSFQKLKLNKLLAENTPKVFADNDQLQQVFLNLFLNARDAMPAGGEISIKTGGNNGEVQIEIADSGTGIDEKDVKKIFDPFFTTKPTGKGTGLGLAVCYGIITAHGGKIEVSSNENQGTTFLIFLPANENAAG
ncbi:MAG TPA: ATP-binding protein, partial [Pyrinomonadaceae bacterium]|nr:ATP-binding protein [Pyrinomonadaceae bacterium]